MRVLVSGASGFIGARVVEALSRQGARVRAASFSRHVAVDAAEQLRADLRDASSVAGLCDGCELVIHCAGLLGRWGVQREALDAVNARGPVLLAEQARRAGVRHFVHVSTTGVCGPCVRGRALHEQSPCRPEGDYARSKLAGERALLERFGAGEMALTIARPSLTYGPGDQHKLPLFRAIARRRFVLLDGGRSLLHPVYVDDVAEALLAAARRDTSAHRARVYTIAGPRALPTREVAETIAAELGVRLWPVALPAAALLPLAGLAERVGAAIGRAPALTRGRVAQWSRDAACDASRARDELGFVAATSFAEGVAETVASYRAAGLL